MAKAIWIENRQHWRLQETIGKQRKSFYSSNPGKRAGPAECRQKYLKALDDYEKGGTNPTFDYAWAEFLKDYKSRYKITSYNAIVSRGKAHLTKRFKRMRLLDISKRDWQKVIDDAFKSGATAKKTLKGIETTIRTFCKFCAGAGMLPDSMVPIHFIIPAKATRAEKRSLQPDELKVLFSADQDKNWFIPIFRFIALTGLRRGEVCALVAARDFDGQSITIRESLSHEGYTTSPKSKESERTIVLSDLALAQIEDHFARRKEQRIISKYLFCKPDATQISARQLGNVWRKWRTETGISITIHELRHTFITYSRTKTSIDLSDLKKIYGHSKDMDTDGTYVHDLAKSSLERQKELTKEKELAKEIEDAFISVIKSK